MMLIQYIIRLLSEPGARFVPLMGNAKNHVTMESIGLHERIGSLRLQSLSANFVLRNLLQRNGVENWYVNGLWTEGSQW
jgi:hypothetical protein